ncbi:MAG: adenylate/guanylate cyclase domain-containing protein [Candidatus Wallbacteria bacterium]|nr:adenylate/guanylate cyclase domain-containing protein [Candidatus Wallbacteria bacterium]
MIPSETGIRTSEEIYRNFLKLLDQPRGADFGELRSLIDLQRDKSLRLKMMEALLDAGWFDWKQADEFLNSFVQNDDLVLSRAIIRRAEHLFEEGGYLFLIRAVSCGKNEVFKLAADVLKRKKMNAEMMACYSDVLNRNFLQRDFVEFSLEQYVRDLKSIWSQLIQSEQFPLDMKLKAMDALKNTGDPGFAKILEKLSQDKEPVVASAAQRILGELYSKFSLSREKHEKETVQQNEQAASPSVMERSRGRLMAVAGAFVLFLLLHLFFGQHIPGAMTYLCYWGFIVYGCAMGMEEGMSVTIGVAAAAPVFNWLNFTPAFKPGILLCFSYLFVGITISMINRNLSSIMAELSKARAGAKNSKARIVTLETQLNSNLDAIQSIKEKLTERTIKLYTLMVNIREITSSIDIDKIALSMAEILVKGLQAQAGQIFLVDPDQGEIFSVKNFRVDGTKLSELPEKRYRISDDPLLSHFFRYKELISSLDFKRNPDLLSISKKTKFPTKVLVPLVLEGQVKAVINIEQRNREEITEDERLLLNAMVSSATIALKNAEVFSMNRETISRFKSMGDMEKKRYMQIREMFEKYVSPSVVNQISEGSAEISLGGDSKEVAILLFDIRGFTSFTENNPPERVVELLNMFFRVTSSVILDHQGTIDKFMGDAVLSLFGAPIPMKDPFIKAAECAFKIKKECALLENICAQKFGFPLQIGQTINYGKAVVGNIGSEKRMEYTAIGDVVNTAARLEDMSQPGNILVPESTYLLLKHRAEGVLIGEFKLRGKQKPINVYNLVRWKENL